MTKKVLIYTDSRGQHTPRGADPHDVFATRLANHPDIDATVILCPMKWTTTLDFFAFLEANADETYDHIILHTGIVEWSPRPQDSAINDLYHNQTPANLGNEGLNTRDYSLKIVNDKKPLFDSAFGAAQIREYLDTELGEQYEGQPTANMYSLDQARTAVLPRLKALDNLIFINSNRFVPGWAGDYTRGRPDNIGLTESYSELFRDTLGPDKTLDLLAWSDADIQRFTCDNIHFTKLGSDWIYQQLCARMGLEEPALHVLDRALEAPTIMSDADRIETLARAGLAPEDKLATLIIGFRFPEGDSSRMQNMMFLLDWIDDHYGSLFDVLLVEQDTETKIHHIADRLRPYVRHEFLYNPRDYNRGWGYNVAVNDMTDLAVVGLLDTDVMTGRNFVQEILDCFETYKAISPYANVYFSNEEEADLVRQGKGLAHLQRPEGVTKPTTIAGGILIARRSTFLEVKGFEQYTGYGGEDRALDVILMIHCAPEELRVAPYVYVHLYHPAGKVDRTHLDAVLEDLSVNYGCLVDRNLSAIDDIHTNCLHTDKNTTTKLIARREASFADPTLYSSERELTIAGHFADATSRLGTRGVMFPEAAVNFADYHSREIYKAPPHDEAALTSLYNKYKGERCFIIGNGPSLNKHDLSLLEGEYTFAVNSFYYKTRETGFRPTFFVVEDSSVMKENAEEIRNYEAPYKFFPTNYRSIHPDAENVLFFHMNRGFYEKSSPNYCVPRFSTDASKVLYCGQSVTYINLQLAYFMGFTEVHLIGMDFDYVIPKEHLRTGDDILSTTDDPNHFHKDYFGVGKTWKDPKIDRVGNNYKQAKLSYEVVGRKIYNATIGGKLEIFERSNYAELFTGKAMSGKVPPTTPQRVKTVAEEPSVLVPETSPVPQPTAPATPQAQTTQPVRPTQTAMRAPEKKHNKTAAPAPDRPFYVEFAEGIRRRSPLAFHALQILWRGSKALLRWPFLLLLLGISGLVGLAGLFLLPPLGKVAILALGGLSVSLGLTVFVGLRARRALINVSTEIQELQVAAQRQKQKNASEIEKTAASLRVLQAGIAKQMASVTKTNQDTIQKMEPLLHLPQDIDRRIEKIFARVEQEANSQHGRYLLMTLLSDEELGSPGALEGKTLIEIGSSRELVDSQRSTQKLAVYTALLGMNFITVDMDPANTSAASKLLSALNPSARAENGKGEVYLGKHVGSIDFVYLDAFDFFHNSHSEERQRSYSENLDTDINDEACWRMHYECAQHLVARMKVGGIVVLDDTWRDEEGKYDGKGRTAIPLLLECGFEIVAQTRMTVALRRVTKPASKSVRKAKKSASPKARISTVSASQGQASMKKRTNE